MAYNSKIQWTEATWNPIVGTKGRWHCTKVSPGCQHCYSERLNMQRGGPGYKVGEDELKIDYSKLVEPFSWRKPRMIFTCSMTDLFHEQLFDEQIMEVFRVMRDNPRHTFQVLTKRARRMDIFMTWIYHIHDGARWEFPLLENVWLGVSAENQKYFNSRVQFLLGVPASTRFVSCEPLLGPIDIDGLKDSPGMPRLDQIIVGGESGPRARPMDLAWAESLVAQCKAVGIPVFVKQLGSAWAKENGSKDRKGGDMADWPEGLRVREFPGTGREWNGYPGSKAGQKSFDFEIMGELPKEEK